MIGEKKPLLLCAYNSIQLKCFFLFFFYVTQLPTQYWTAVVRFVLKIESNWFQFRLNFKFDLLLLFVVLQLYTIITMVLVMQTVYYDYLYPNMSPVQSQQPVTKVYKAKKIIDSNREKKNCFDLLFSCRNWTPTRAKWTMKRQDKSTKALTRRTETFTLTSAIKTNRRSMSPSTCPKQEIFTSCMFFSFCWSLSFHFS